MPTVTPVDVYLYEAAKSAAYSEGGGNHITLTTTDGTVDGATSGDVLIVDLLGGVCLGDYNAHNDEVVIDISGVHNLSVTAKNGSGNSAVLLGDIICFDSAATPDEINKDNTNGVWFGIALGTIAAGETATIPVKLIPGLPAIGKLVQAAT